MDLVVFVSLLTIVVHDKLNPQPLGMCMVSPLNHLGCRLNAKTLRLWITCCDKYPRICIFGFKQSWYKSCSHIIYDIALVKL
jgi:hypothetical protein